MRCIAAFIMLIRQYVVESLDFEGEDDVGGKAAGC